MRDPDGPRDVARAVELAGRQRGRDGGDGERRSARGRVRRARRRARSRRRRRRRRSPSRAPRPAPRAPARSSIAAQLRWAAASAAPRRPWPARPAARAAAAQSACSGATLTISPSQAAELHAHRLARHLDGADLAVQLEAVAGALMRTPSVPSRAASPRRRRARRRAARARDSTKPGRPFFICAGAVQTSSAPAAKHAAGGVGHELGRGGRRGWPRSATTGAPAAPAARADDRADDVRHAPAVARAGAVAGGARASWRGSGP